LLPVKKTKGLQEFFPEALQNSKAPGGSLCPPGALSFQLFNKALHRMNAPKKEEASKITYKLRCHACHHAVFRSNGYFISDYGILFTALFYACQHFFSGPAGCFTTKRTKVTKNGRLCELRALRGCKTNPLYPGPAGERKSGALGEG
jgi:hypothetical protein